MTRPLPVEVVPVQAFEVRGGVNLYGSPEGGGGLYAKREEAEAEAARRQLAAWFVGSGICCGGEWDQQMVFDALVKNASELSDLLRAIAERPR